MTVQVVYSAKTFRKEASEQTSLKKQGQERHLGRTAIPNTTLKTKKDLLIKVKKKFKKFWIFIVGEEGRTQLSRFALRFFEAAAIQLNCVC